MRWRVIVMGSYCMMEFPERSVAFEVRDYECDLQGIVNHAVYLNYMEHARHAYLKSLGFSFAELTAQGFFLMVARAEVTYRRSLVSEDLFDVVSQLSVPKRVKGEFLQRIFRRSDNELMIEARFTLACVREGRVSSILDVFNGVF